MRDFCACETRVARVLHAFSVELVAGLYRRYLVYARARCLLIALF